jgi:hypothetical protein
MTPRIPGSPFLPLSLSLSLLGCAAQVPPAASTAPGEEKHDAVAEDPTLPLFVFEGERKVRRKLETIVDVDVKEKKLQAFVEEIGSKIGVPVILSESGLQNAMVEVDAPVTLRLKGASAIGALHCALDPLNLTFIINDDVLVVTDKSSTRRINILRIYSIADLCLARKGGSYVERGNEISKVIRESIDRDVWEDGGGDATIQWIPALLALSVSAPEETQPKVVQFLAGLRAVKGKSNDLLKSTGLPSLDEVTATLESPRPPDWARQAAAPANAAPPVAGLDETSAASAASAAEAAKSAADESRRIGERALKLALKLDSEWEQLRAARTESKKPAGAPK